MSNRRQSFFQAEDDDEDLDDVISEAIEDEVEEENVDGDDFDEEEDDGEDLLGEGYERDYRPMPELDAYDPTLLDDTHRRQSQRGRREAEDVLNQRDRILNKNKLKSKRMPSILAKNIQEEEEEEDNLGVDQHERRRRRLLEARLAARMQTGTDVDIMDDDIDGGDEDDYNLMNEEVTADTDWSMNGRLGLRIKSNFTKFLNTFTADRNPPSTPPYSKMIDEIISLNLSSIHVSFQPDLVSWSPTLADWVIDYPSRILPILHYTLGIIVRERSCLYEDDVSKEFFVRIDNVSFKDAIRNLRGHHINHLISISGVVSRRSNIFPSLRLLYLNCLKCSYLNGPYEISIVSEDSRRPSLDSLRDLTRSCASCSSRGPFSINREETIYRNYQTIFIQETPGSVPAGRLPRSREAILVNDLVDSVKPGDQVSVNGTYLCKFDSFSNIRSGFPVFKTFIEVNSIIRKNELKFGSVSSEDIAALHDLSQQSNIRSRIINSIAPSIYGEEHMKTCVAMAMFGGREKKVADGKHRIRGDVNILILGDPGMAKSQILKYVEQTFHRAVFTTGKGASAVGLTASVRRDPSSGSGDYVLEGGALVMADQGICLIDEFDKMNDHDRTSIHEAMEQQSISVSKAGIVASLSARCSVIAAANPIGGRYDPQKSFIQNVDLTDPILSRFDCLCVLRDEIDVFKDEALADFVMCSHMKNHPIHPNTSVVPIKLVTSDSQISQHDQIPQDILKKYILYARTNIHPSLTEIDSNKLSSFYQELRRVSADHQGINLTVRHLESLIRMSEANAKIRLDTIVRSKDVDFAIATMLSSFIQTQKYSVAESLRRRFESRYITSVLAYNDLIHFVLKKLMKKKFDLQAISNIEDDRNNNMTTTDTLSIQLSDLSKEISLKYKLGDGGELNAYLESDMFLGSFVMEAGKIYKREDDE